MIIPLAPITPTGLLCLGCGSMMRMEIQRYANGKVSRVVFYCDLCKYGHEPSMIHAPGVQVKYVPPVEDKPVNPAPPETPVGHGG